jgi:ATP-dependent Clp protease, protease subunit
MRNRMMQLLSNRATVPAVPIRAEATTNGLEVRVYDVIDPWFGATAAAFADAIKGAASGTPLTVRVNSPGGDVFEGRAIASLIRAHAGPTRAIVDGLAASAASTVALAAQSTIMAKGAMLMIHQAWGFAVGNSAEMTATAALLDKVDGELAAEYAAKTGCTLKQAAEWMAAETWFTADEAVTAKFANSVADDPATFAAWNLTAFDHAPSGLVERIAALSNRPSGPTPEEMRAHAARRLRLYETA